MVKKEKEKQRKKEEEERKEQKRKQKKTKLVTGPVETIQAHDTFFSKRLPTSQGPAVTPRPLLQSIN